MVFEPGTGAKDAQSCFLAFGTSAGPKKGHQKSKIHEKTENPYFLEFSDFLYNSRSTPYGAVKLKEDSFTKTLTVVHRCTPKNLHMLIGQAFS